MVKSQEASLQPCLSRETLESPIQLTLQWSTPNVRTGRSTLDLSLLCSFGDLHGQFRSQGETYWDQASRIRFRASRNHHDLYTLSQHSSSQQTARRDSRLRRRNRIRSIHGHPEKIPLEEPRRQ